MTVTFTPRARRDLAEIGAWISKDRPRAAERMVERLILASESLGSLSLRYPETLRSLRQRPVGACQILYRVGSTVEIIRILHSARDRLSLLDES